DTMSEATSVDEVASNEGTLDWLESNTSPELVPPVEDVEADWLAELETNTTTTSTTEDESVDWLAELETGTEASTTEDEGIDWLAELSTVETTHVDEVLDADNVAPDWLADHTSPELVAPVEDVKEDWLAGLETDTETSTTEDGGWLATSLGEASEITSTDDLLGSLKPSDNLPDWLGDDVLPEPVAPAEGEDLPDWLQDMMAGKTSSIETDLSVETEGMSDVTAGTSPDLASLIPTDSEIPHMPDDIVSADLPDWLKDSVTVSDTASLVDLVESKTEMPALPFEASDVSSDDLPDWLAPTGGKDFMSTLGEVKEVSTSKTEDSDDHQGWENILGTAADTGQLILPSASEFEAMGGNDTPELTESKIPEWLEAYKPHTLRSDGEQDHNNEPAQETGPLAGVRGVIDIEPAIAQPRQAKKASPQLTVTEAQKRQMAILRHLQDDQSSTSTAVRRKHTPPLAKALRWLIVVLLFALALLGFFFRDELTKGIGLSAVPNMSAETTAAFTIIDEARGKPVVIGVDYSPAYGGELDGLLATLLTQLDAQGSEVWLVSQSAAGVGIGDTAVLNAGISPEKIATSYIPGDQVGLRLLADCLLTPCTDILGSQLNLPTSPALLILLTANQDNLVDWV
ncbi:MAG: hypothetical protein KAG66_16965, partial [Methylococcales bacterium]|nr:hypothetical protein [Methylococcales bacterium]